MIIEKITLHNFGIYQGTHLVDLNVNDIEKNIILFGGLNGGGKTTFLDSLQLVLYGKNAKCSNRGRLPYNDFLYQSINRFSKDKSAYISMDFRHKHGTKEQKYKVTRSWEATVKKQANEKIIVACNNEIDMFLSEHWDDFVSEFIPQNLSELFFFDGEKIENLADPISSAKLIKTGIEALLGLDLLSQLSKDLNIAKQKKQSTLLDDKEFKKVAEIKEIISKLELNASSKHQEINNITDRIYELEFNIDQKRAELQNSGAFLLDELDNLKDEEKNLENTITAINTELKKCAAGALPLLLAKKLFSDVELYVQNETTQKEYKIAKKYINEHTSKLLDLCSNMLSEEQLEKIKLELKNLNAQSHKNYTALPYEANVSLDIFNLAKNSITNDLSESEYLIESKKIVYEKLLLVKQKLESIPSFQSVAEDIKSLAIIEHDLNIEKGKLEISLDEFKNIEYQLHEQQARLSSALLKENIEHFEGIRSKQVVEHIDDIKAIIDSFKDKLIKENVAKLESQIKLMFCNLERKSTLINQVKIDTNSYCLTLIGQDGAPILPTRLSAGERQLISVAVLWALASTSGKEIPSVIDTPMGRLDGKHRTKLIKNYFPRASDQVILLSTDEEITGKYYNDLKPFVAKEYHIQYNEELKTSTISSGYFGG